MAGFPRGFRRRSGTTLSNASSMSNIAGSEAASEALPVKPHPPNKKQHEADLKEIDQLIAKKESDVERLSQDFEATKAGNSARREEINKELQQKNDDLKATNSRIEALHAEIQKKLNQISQARTGITYKDEAKIDQTIARLEQHRTNAYHSLPEEQKIIREIDMMKRSKGELRRLNKLIEEKEAMEKTLHALRDERKAKFEEQRRVTARDKTFRDLDAKHSQDINTIDNEIYLLKKTRSRKIKAHNNQVKAWDDHQASVRKLKALEFQQQSGSRPPDRTPDAVRDPYASIRQVITSLLAYIHMLEKQSGDTPQSSMSLESAPTDSLAPPVHRPPTPPPGPSTSSDETPGYFYKKYSDAVVTQKIFSKGKKEKKKNKPLTHNATVLAQFMELNLLPPSTTAEIPRVLEQLNAKKASLPQPGAQFSGSASTTPKASPEDETPPTPFPPVDPDELISPAENDLLARQRAMSSRVPSITLSTDGMEFTLFDNSEVLAKHDPLMTASHLEEVDAGNTDDYLTDPDLNVRDTSGSDMLGKHEAKMEEAMDLSYRRTDSGIETPVLPNELTIATPEEEMANLTISTPTAADYVSEEDPSVSASEETADNSAEDDVELPTMERRNTVGKEPENRLINIVQLKTIDSPPVMINSISHQGTQLGSCPAKDVVDGRLNTSMEIISSNMCPETPPIDEALSKRPNFVMSNEDSLK